MLKTYREEMIIRSRDCDSEGTLRPEHAAGRAARRSGRTRAPARLRPGSAD